MFFLDIHLQGPRTVETIAREVHLTVANTSRHLQILRTARLIDAEKEGLVTVVDVRPAEEYRAGHIAGAISIPLRELQDRLAELPRDQEMEALVRFGVFLGVFCTMAFWEY